MLQGWRKWFGWPLQEVRDNPKFELNLPDRDLVDGDNQRADYIPRPSLRRNGDPELDALCHPGPAQFRHGLGNLQRRKCKVEHQALSPPYRYL